jgi:putative ABC transport system permease protein
MFWHNARSGVHALRVNAPRSLLTILGIVMGVAAIIAMIAMGTGAEVQLAEQIRSLGSNLLIVVTRSSNVRGVRAGGGTHVTLTDADAFAIQREVPVVQAAAPTLGRTLQVVAANHNWATLVTGITPEWLEVKDWHIVEGRGLVADDYLGAGKVALIGQTAAHHLFGEGSPLGATIRIHRVPFTIVGVLGGKGPNTHGHDQDDVVMVPLSTARHKLFGRVPGKVNAVWVITVKIQAGEDFADAQTQIRELLRQRHRLRDDQDDDFTIRDPSETYRAQQEASRTLTALLAAIAAVSLLVGGIGIMNIMLISVTERTREIGLRMAVGARRRDILTQFLIEAVALSLIGSALGVALGVGGSWAIGYFADWHTIIQPDAIALAVAVAVATGILFGLYPARQAALLDPIEALQYQ